MHHLNYRTPKASENSYGEVAGQSPQVWPLALRLSCIKMDAMRTCTTPYKQSGPLSKVDSFEAAVGTPLVRVTYAASPECLQYRVGALGTLIAKSSE